MILFAQYVVDTWLELRGGVYARNVDINHKTRRRRNDQAGTTGPLTGNRARIRHG